MIFATHAQLCFSGRRPSQGCFCGTRSCERGLHDGHLLTRTSGNGGSRRSRRGGGAWRSTERRARGRLGSHRSHDVRKLSCLRSGGSRSTGYFSGLGFGSDTTSLGTAREVRRASVKDAWFGSIFLNRAGSRRGRLRLENGEGSSVIPGADSLSGVNREPSPHLQQRNHDGVRREAEAEEDDPLSHGLKSGSHLTSR